MTSLHSAQRAATTLAARAAAKATFETGLMSADRLASILDGTVSGKDLSAARKLAKSAYNFPSGQQAAGELARALAAQLKQQGSVESFSEGVKDRLGIGRDPTRAKAYEAIQGAAVHRAIDRQTASALTDKVADGDLGESDLTELKALLQTLEARAVRPPGHLLDNEWHPEMAMAAECANQAHHLRFALSALNDVMALQR